MRRSRLENRIILMVILIVAVTVGCCMAAYTFIFRSSLDDEITQEIAYGREGIRKAVSERAGRAELIARLLAANPQIGESIISGGSLSLLSVLREHRGRMNIDILSVIDKDGVIISRLETAQDVESRRIRSGEPVFLNPLFKNAVAGLASTGVELCLPDVVCVDSYARVYTGPGSDRRLVGYVSAGYMLDNDFAREIRGTSGTDYILLRRKRVLSSSISSDSLSPEEVRQLSDMISMTEAGGHKGADDTISRQSLGGEPYAMVSSLVEDAAGRSVGLQVIGRNMADMEAMWREGIFFAIAIAVVAVLMALGVGVYTARRIFMPMRRLTESAGNIADGNYDVKIFIKQKDEIGELAGAFNEMSDALKERERNLKEATRRLRVNQDQLIQSGRLAAVGELAAGVAHEIGNPLSAISGYAQMLQRRPSLEEKDREFAKQIEREAEFIEKIIQDLLHFSRPSKQESTVPEPADIVKLLYAAHKTVSAHKAFRKVNLQVVFPDNFPEVPCFHKEIMQVFLNLLMNAAQAMENGGRIIVEGVVLADHVKIKVRDTGPGIPASTRRRIFDPFFTTKPPGVGTGLGLSICYRIIEKHGGKMVVEDSLRGACFSFTLPRDAGGDGA